jgi:hypothetical protein
VRVFGKGGDGKREPVVITSTGQTETVRHYFIIHAVPADMERGKAAWVVLAKGRGRVQSR